MTQPMSEVELRQLESMRPGVTGTGLVRRLCAEVRRLQAELKILADAYQDAGDQWAKYKRERDRLLDALRPFARYEPEYRGRGGWIDEKHVPTDQD